ncbi:Patellin-4 [Dactylellina cionopaga]|nr:Patellin-4 [Dactylellina cionopaga]
MAEEVKPAEPPVATATDVEPTKTEKVGSPAPEQPIETAAATTAAPEGAAPAAKSEEANEAPAPTEPALPQLTNAQWGPVSPNLATIYRKLPEIFEQGDGYTEVYGVTLSYNAESTEPAFSTLLILQKFLRANSDNMDKAVEQLIATLKWRKEKKPLDSMAAVHDRSAFEGLGYVQVTETDVLTWNIYGAVKDYQKTFGDLERFLTWRVALMEVAIAKLDLSNTTKPIPDFGKGPDPHQIVQVHDYLNTSFLRMDPAAKVASKAAPALFKDYYPEMLSRKFFVNVPVVMGWLYKATTMLLSQETVRKFRVLSYGKELHTELGEEVPEVYGGKGVKELKELGDPVQLTPVEEVVAPVEQASATEPDTPAAATA